MTDINLKMSKASEKYWFLLLKVEEKLWLAKNDFDKSFSMQKVPKKRLKEYEAIYKENKKKHELVLRAEGLYVLAISNDFEDFVRRMERNRLLNPLHDKKTDLTWQVVRTAYPHCSSDGYSKANRESWKRLVQHMAKKGIPYFVEKNKPKKRRHYTYLEDGSQIEVPRSQIRKSRPKLNLGYCKCLLCSNRKDLEQHHIQEEHKFKDKKRYHSPENVVWLCKKCHFEIAHDCNYSRPMSEEVIAGLQELNPNKKK